jgi:hypothetical protein
MSLGIKVQSDLVISVVDTGAGFLTGINDSTKACLTSLL